MWVAFYFFNFFNLKIYLFIYLFIKNRDLRMIKRVEELLEIWNLSF